MYSIKSQTVFYEYYNKIHEINASFVSLGLQPLGITKRYNIFILISTESCHLLLCTIFLEHKSTSILKNPRK